ncbi:hypothetical protein PR048_002685 [Dryococelus australis]|uniref:Neurotransmitter-gated ion-channel transmembrane domain-containing protein n=1 Tax=Dryococelus australis TaxID=614101 RepID=A0ABQ9IMC3_9NEOP|nr:hypothetical protein PR048_002685 [Dryococelus australis]
MEAPAGNRAQFAVVEGWCTSPSTTAALHAVCNVFVSITAPLRTPPDMEVLSMSGAYKCELGVRIEAKAKVEEETLDWIDKKSGAAFYQRPAGKELRIPKFKVQLAICERNYTVYHAAGSNFVSTVSGNVSALRFWVILQRELTNYLLETYIPTGLFVIVSWGSFLINPEMVPGRMVLLVTNLLSLITLFEATRTSSPPCVGVKSMDVWVLGCISFVVMALMEYCVILYLLKEQPDTRTDCRLFTNSTDVKSRNENNSRLKPHVTATSLFRPHSPLPNRKGHTTALAMKSALPSVSNETFKTAQLLARGAGTTNFSTELRKNVYKRKLHVLLRRYVDVISNKCLKKRKGSWFFLDRISLVIFPVAFIVFSSTYWIVMNTKLISAISHYGEPGSISCRVPPVFRMWESCRTILLVGGFLRGSPVSPTPSFRRCSILTSIALIGSQDLAVKSCPNLFTHSLTSGWKLHWSWFRWQVDRLSSRHNRSSPCWPVSISSPMLDFDDLDHSRLKTLDQDSKLETLDPKHKTLDPRLKTQNPRLQTKDP